MHFAAVTALSLALATTTLAVTPPLGPGVPVSVPEYGPTVAEKWTSDIATDGHSYFVVWNDRRRSLSYHIYGTRVSADGQVLDPAGIPFGRGEEPSVTATGHGYALAWHANNGYYAATYADGAVQITRIGDATGECPGAKVASNGNTILVATCGRDLFLLDHELHVLKQMRLATKVGNLIGLAVTPIGDEYLIAVASPDYPFPIVTQKIDSAGNLQAAKRVTDSQRTDSLDIVSNGNESLAVWRETSHLVGRVIARDESSGATRIVGQADVNLPHPDRALHSPGMAWLGGQYLMLYMRGGYQLPPDLFLTHVDAAGAPVGEPVLAATDTRAHDSPDIAVKSDGSGAAAWLDGKWSVRVGLFDSASLGTETPFRQIIDAASGAHEQLLPAVERVEEHAVTAWLDRSIGTSNIRIARPGTTPLLVASNTDAQWLDIAYDGNTVWVAWFGKGKLGVRRYTALLSPVDAEPRLFDPPAGASVAVAGAAGDGALAVVWRTMPLDYEDGDLVASILRADGTMRELAISGMTEDGVEDSAVAVWDGARFFVAWRYKVMDGGEPPYPVPVPIRALHVTSAGEAVESSPVELHLAVITPGTLKAASSPQGVVLAWTELGDDLSVLTRVARYTGATPLDPSAPLARGTLAGIAPLANGEVDVYWWTSPRFHQEVAMIRYERFSASLASRSDFFTTQPFPVNNQQLELVATVVGTRPVVVHTQVDDSAEAAGISRLFIRQQGMNRRRAVR